MRLRSVGIIAITICISVLGWAVYRQRQLDRGHETFMTLCAECHNAGGAPNLSRVAAKYDRAMMVRFVSNPQDVYRDRGRSLNDGYPRMPRVKATPEEVALVVDYLRSVSR